MIAVLRRLIGLGLLLAALLVLFWPAEGVWSVRVLKPDAEGRAVKRMGAPRTVEGPAWAELFQRAAQSGGRLYLPLDSEPLAGLAAAGGEGGFLISLADKPAPPLSVFLQPPFAYRGSDDVAWGLNHANAWLAPWLALAGVLVYVLLPRPKRSADQARYKVSRSQVGPDLLALVLGGVFLVLPMLIVAQFSTRGLPLGADGGWLVLTLICWAITLLSLANGAVAAWYEGLSFTLTGSGIRKTNLKGTREYAFEDMKEIIPGVFQAPGWLRKVAWLMVVFNPGLAGPVILGAHTQAPAVLIPCRDGRFLSIMTKHLTGWDMLEQALTDAGVKYALLEEGSKKPA